MNMETFCYAAPINRCTPVNADNVLGVIDGRQYTIGIRHSALREYLTSTVPDGALVPLYYEQDPYHPRRLNLLAARTDCGTMLTAPLGTAHVLVEYLMKPAMVMFLGFILLSILNLDSSSLLPGAAGMGTLGIAAYRDWRRHRRADAYRHPNEPA